MLGDFTDHEAKSYLIRSGLFRDVISNIPQDMSDSWPAFFGQHCFGIIKPDAVVSGRIIPIKAWLEARGINIRYAAPIWSPQEYQFEELYKYNISLRNEQTQIGSWWINRQLYTAGCSILVLLSSDSQEECIYSLLARLKGASDPSKSRPGELRFDLGATNTALNLFHCADDRVSSMREALIFLTTRTINDCISEKVSSNEGVDRLQNLEACIGQRQDLHPGRVIARVIGRIATAHGGDIAEFFSDVICLESYGFSYLHIKKELSECVMSRCSKYEPDIGLAALLHPRKFGYGMADKCVVALQNAGFLLGIWEPLVLRTTAHYECISASAFE